MFLLKNMKFCSIMNQNKSERNKEELEIKGDRCVNGTDFFKICHACR